ncbi:MAG: thiaminase II [Clostridia bacterium]|nr:thiaminase II [Clostridia bacterium]
MKLIDKMIAVTTDIWSEYNKHPFVKGIEDGTLDREKFRYYIIQDYLYLIEYTKVFGIGIAKAKSTEIMRLFASYVHLLTDGEMDIHRGYMGKFGVTEAELADTPRALDNLSYTSYMLRIAYEEGEAEVLAAILSCAYSYEVIARNIVKNNPDSLNHEFYGEWICGYASDEYSAENKVLIAMLEKLTAHYTDEQKQHIVDIYVACSRYELAFWDLAWNMSK